MEDGEQNAFRVADLLGEDAAAGAGVAEAAASLMGEPFGLRGLSGRESFGQLAQFVAAHPGQGRGGKSLDDSGSGGADVLGEEGEQVAGGAETDRREPGVVAVVFEDFTGLLHEVPDAGGSDLQQVGQDVHRADLPLIDHGDQDAGGVVEQWFAAWAAGGPPGSTLALFGVALLGAGGLSGATAAANCASSGLVMPVSRGSASRSSMARRRSAGLPDAAGAASVAQEAGRDCSV